MAPLCLIRTGLKIRRLLVRCIKLIREGNLAKRLGWLMLMLSIRHSRSSLSRDKAAMERTVVPQVLLVCTLHLVGIMTSKCATRYQSLMLISSQELVDNSHRGPQQ